LTLKKTRVYRACHRCHGSRGVHTPPPPLRAATFPSGAETPHSRQLPIAAANHPSKRHLSAPIGGYRQLSAAKAHCPLPARRSPSLSAKASSRGILSFQSCNVHPLQPLGPIRADPNHSAPFRGSKFFSSTKALIHCSRSVDCGRLRKVTVGSAVIAPSPNRTSSTATYTYRHLSTLKTLCPV
jgi:hypothetical protein